MLTVITETGDLILIDNALMSAGDAAMKAYVAAGRQTLKLPVTPLHGERDKAKIQDLIKKRGEPTAVIEPAAQEG